MVNRLSKMVVYAMVKTNLKIDMLAAVRKLGKKRVKVYFISPLDSPNVKLNYCPLTRSHKEVNKRKYVT